MSLKGVPFKCRDPVSDEAVQAIRNQVHDDIDPAIQPGQYQKKDLTNKAGMQVQSYSNAKLRRLNFYTLT